MLNRDQNQLASALASLVARLITLPEEARQDHAALACLIETDGIFDSDYYLGRYPDIGAAGINPALHYVRFGFREKRHPGRWHEELAEQGCLYGAPDAVSVAAEMECALASLLNRRNTFAPPLVLQGSYEALIGMPLSVHWSITSRCNYRCSYCSFFLPKEAAELYEPDRGTLLNAVDKLAALKRPSYQFVLLGGEPTLRPDLPDLLAHMDKSLDKRLKNLVIVTNGSRKAEYFNQFAELARRVDFQIMNSIHLEFKKPEDVYALVEEIDQAFQLNLLIMAHPEKLALAKQIHANLCELRKDKPFQLLIHPIYGAPDFNTPDSRYTQDFFAWWNEAQQEFNEINIASAASSEKEFRPFANCFWEIQGPWGIARLTMNDRFKLTHHGWLNFRGKFCITGAHLLRIEETGELKGTTCGHAPTGLNIYTDELDADKFMRIVRCPADICICSDNDLLMKFASENDAHCFLAEIRKRQERTRLPSL